jgi:hypothetical protein
MADITYQNPGVPTSELDSRVVGYDPGGSGLERRREATESPTELELLQQILLELRAIKTGIISLATNTPNAAEQDFHLDNFQDSYTL